MEKCDLAAQRVEWEVRWLKSLMAEHAPEDTPEDPPTHHPHEVDCYTERKHKKEYMECALDCFKEIHHLLHLKEVSIREQILRHDNDLEEEEEERHRLDHLLGEMANTFDKMETHFYRILGVEDGWFSVQTERWRSWVMMNPGAAGCTVATVATCGATFGSGVGMLFFLLGIRISSLLHLLHIGIPTLPFMTPGLGAVLGGSYLSGRLLHHWACTPAWDSVYLVDKAKNDIAKVKDMVAEVERAPNQQFLEALKKLEGDAEEAFNTLPLDHRDRLCVLCLSDGAEVSAPVKAPGCKGAHFMCKDHWEEWTQQPGGVDRRCSVCRE